MKILSVSKLQKEFNGDILFKNISFDINSTNKIALIGKNGTGKSTLLKMILKRIDSDAGEIHINKQASIGYLSQDVISSKNHSLYDEMLSVFSHLTRLKAKIDDTTDALKHDPHNQILIDQYAQLEDRYQIQGGYDYHYKIDYVLSQFGFSKDVYSRDISTFSGGEKTRVAFSKLLLENPDLLILDEPTNHLDIEIISWLEDYLSKFEGALLVVTHDKYFVNKVCSKMIEIDHHTAHVYHGTYEMYEEEKAKRYEQRLRQYRRQQKEIEHLQSFIDRFRYNSKRASIAKDRAKKIERMDKIDKPMTSKRRVKMSLTGRRATTDIILEAKKLSIGYADNVLLEDIDFNMRGYEKLGIIGPNGTGKTTLLNTLRKQMKPLSGHIHFLRRYRIGYFDQNQDTLHYDKTIFEEIHDRYPMFTNYDVREKAAKFLFFNDDLDKPIHILSGGEKVRLTLLLLMLEQPELLILDEPTNHLDIDTKDIIEDVIEQFEGPVIFVSHDRYFINRIATKIVYLTEETYYEHTGSFDTFYDQYLTSLRTKHTKQTLRKDTQQSADLTKDLKHYEHQIDDLHLKLEQLETSSFDEENYLDPEKGRAIQEKIKTLQNDLKHLEEHYFDILEKTEKEV
jgi:ATP-binding cassette subfamily F protein 3